MFTRARHTSASSSGGGGQGTYTRLQQHDDFDDDFDDLTAQTSIARHPNSLLVSSSLHSAIVPPLPQATPLPEGDPIATITATTTTTTPGGGEINSDTILEDDNEEAGLFHFSARASMSAKRAAEIPIATQRYIRNKLPFRKKTATEASFASLPQVIMADIQQGDMPSQADPMLKELPKRGWTIVRRRRFRGGRRRMLGKNKKHVRGMSLTPLSFDNTLAQTDQLSTSVFVKWDPNGAAVASSSAASLPSQLSMQRVSSPPQQLQLEQQQQQQQQQHQYQHKDIPVSKEEFESVVQSVRSAIDNGGVQPTRISQGSSGSYFCRNSQGKIVGVFKPKNEEPYGRLNPKWTKWIHRHLFPCCFGRSCLIPNLGYISEAASSLIDRRLGTCLVPHTDVIHLASPSFHYDYLDRRSASVVGLPPKIGSFQCFLDGFQDANLFLRDHPFPVDQYHSSSSLMRGTSVWAGCMGQDTYDDDDDEDYNNNNDEGDDHHLHQHNNNSADGYAALTSHPRDAQEMFAEVVTDERYESDQTHVNRSPTAIAHTKKGFRWKHRIQDQFKVEFEQLVILDYLIRNTDRGLDNWMIKFCQEGSSTSSNSGSGSSSPTASGSLLDAVKQAYVQVAAIDNGLAFPFKHPDQWRSYPYGWLALPEPLIARPFSETTRHKFLSVLSDPVWWRQTVHELHDLFKTDSDFDERMFQRQIAVLKGQGFNIVRALSDPHATPIDLVATERVLVNREEILIEYDERLIQQRSPHQQQQSPRRLRTKRSTSFDLSMHQSSSSSFDSIPAQLRQQQQKQQQGQEQGRLPWRDRITSRMSVDLGRRRRRRLMKNLRLGRNVGSDGENESSSDDESEDDTNKNVRKRVTIIMETIEVVKSKKPYFTCC
ncbi:phosphatidylinositol 3 and 4-kinase-domain-containing protein [Zychaea mexicana]|uniref:phosphatidylinositol 3 and 4-kinase-domain-containing protein n=1 Tax=Zychaea mexicana TaxID=64656 RepID=UPI0022FF1EEE|nr:phosphatidylinositol 3 and 4-kinase-domain-containing protein [Zychaea mexicana]KAI9490636.1 phosphatidylinositol 3 and 4-kinase-domain-containing protein [Zychaea mexicana]